MADRAHATPEETSHNVQANILRASKFTIDNKEIAQNWSLFFFFRILPEAEFDVMIERMQGATAEDDGTKRELWCDFAQTKHVNAGLRKQRSADSHDSSPGSEPDRPADAFLNWLKALVSADKSGIKNTADRMLNLSSPASAQSQAAQPTKLLQTRTPNVAWLDPADWIPSRFNNRMLDVDFLQKLVRMYTEPDDYAAQLDFINDKVRDAKVEDAAPDDTLGPLATVTLYEILRQCAPAWMNPAADSAKPSEGIVRGEAAKDPKLDTPIKDSTPINIAFTYSGLAALKMNGTTLSSFPDAFKEGMAARADRLHDTGESAPDNWEGELGLPSVHGYFTGGFALSDRDRNAAKESFWKAMRRDVEAFNDPVSDRGRQLRFGLQILFRLFGLEVLHIELGQAPYTVEAGAVKYPKYRFEHFGFRDGLSQPFVDLGLGDPATGGGTPSKNGTWNPVAPGEIFLDLPDEDNQVQRLPISRKLCVGSTFLVFRKLEQDVSGFRAFLSRCRPGDQKAQDALAAQLVGRWPNGVPLVLSPDHERSADEGAEALNNFRYAADDPLGAKCPLGAHVRRANPRDIGGRGEARRHRILRRGISYGGPLLGQGERHDGEKRGLLFIAANSRIDLQFEVIQANWINGGEFLGQAGLGRCPLTGNHNGATSDSFLEAGASAPMTGLPRFVTTRGGDYFFAPGIEALREISTGGRFKPTEGEIPFAGFSMGDATTPRLLDADRLRKYGHIILRGDKPDIHVEIPSSDEESSKFCFIGQYDDVARVLRNKESAREPGRPEFSVHQYRVHGRGITRGSDFVIATEAYGSTVSTRNRLHAILYKAWQTLAKAHERDGIENFIQDTAKRASEAALRRTGNARRIDLIKDLAARATYDIIRRVYGVPGPEWLTELAPALRFARRHVGDLPGDWIAKLVSGDSDEPGLATLQIWSTIILADLIGNARSVQQLHVLSRQAGSEMVNYLDLIISRARAARASRTQSSETPPTQSSKTLVDAFVANQDCPEIQERYDGLAHDGDWQSLYYRDVSTLLLEIVGTSMATIPLTFGAVMAGLFKFQIDLFTLIGMPGVCPSRIIYEAERLNPNLPFRMRYCETDTDLASGAKIKKGERVVCLIGAANLDGRVFNEPLRFSLDRDIKKYLLFNDEDNQRKCWGRDRVAMVVLRECLTAASRLQGLRRVAGKGGEQTLLGVTVSLPARFTRVAASHPDAHPAARSAAPSSMGSCQIARRSPSAG